MGPRAEHRGHGSGVAGPTPAPRAAALPAMSCPLSLADLLASAAVSGNAPETAADQEAVGCAVRVRLLSWSEMGTSGGALPGTRMARE